MTLTTPSTRTRTGVFEMGDPLGAKGTRGGCLKPKQTKERKRKRINPKLEVKLETLGIQKKKCRHSVVSTRAWRG